MRRVGLAAVCAAGVLAVGCQRGPALAPVEGTVTVGGKPAEKVYVEFTPDGGGPASSATTDAAGRYSLVTAAGAAGAVVGSHKVVLRDVAGYPDKILGRKAENMDFSKGHKPRFGGTYGDVARTPVTKTVAAGPTNRIDIEVK